VITVGASSHLGTVDRSDDMIAAFSSRGPTAIDLGAKPDLVAPGVGIESLSAPDSFLYETKPAYLLAGTVATPYLPYLSLSGTSMAAPVVAGTVALMLQANPALPPNLVKAILEYTAQAYSGYDALTQGAGFLNARGAVELARYFAAAGAAFPATEGWARAIIWGNQRMLGGWLTADGSAWSAALAWGDRSKRVVWGTICWQHCDASNAVWVPWGARPAQDNGNDPATLQSGNSDNVVWGPACGGSDCPQGTAWGTADGDTVVWGSSDGDTVVWGSGCTDASCDVMWNQP
jgi:hypothetical protein